MTTRTAPIRLGPRTRVLVAIAHHGDRNRQHLRRVLANYQDMTDYETDVVLLVDEPRDLGSDVDYIVGAPLADPWSLPFRHQPLFAERSEQYDLFIYSEDDILITERNLNHFEDLAATLDPGLVPGFLRYELSPSGRRNYADIAYGFHWDPDSIFRHDGQLFAHLTNPHSATYVLTRQQLQQCVRSGRYLEAPYRAGGFDLLVAAASWPFVQCGLHRVIPLSSIDDVSVHHLPNTYVRKVGLDEEALEHQIHAMGRIAEGTLSKEQLLAPPPARPSHRWDKSYFESPPAPVERLRRRRSKRLLSVGVGAGDLEISVAHDGAQVTGVPLDEVIGSVARSKGIRTTSPTLERSIQQLSLERFDQILLINVLQHLENPVRMLRLLTPLLASDGQVVATVPNLRRFRLQQALGRRGRDWVPTKGFAADGLHPTSPRRLRRWLRLGGLTVTTLEVTTRQHHRRPPSALGYWLGTEVTAWGSAAEAT